MRGGEAPVSPGETPGNDARFARGRLARVASRWSVGALMVTAVLVAAHGFDDPAVARTSVAPVLSCPAGMTLDSSSGQCLTPRTETVLRPSSCSGGSVRVPGRYGGHTCQTKVTRTVDTGRTRKVYSHTTYAEVWVPTGTKTVQTGTKRRWVPARKVVEPVVPPMRVRTGTIRRCAFDHLTGKSYNCRNVPVYGYQKTQTVTIPGYWSETPVYSEVETGYWDRVPTIHHTTVPIYKTVVEWVTTSVTQGRCPSGWQPAGRQCSRTVLGKPSTAPTQSCPSGSVPRYGDALGGTGPSVLTCQSSAPGSNPDTGTEQESSGGPDDSPDGGARPLHHLASESDERLAELGIHRCANGLLSYVPCDELPGRTWDSDPDVCDGIEGTTYRPDHGGTCVTGSDLLNKCTTPGDCEETTIRTYCPAIGELANTQIQEHAHPDRGAETYRVCVFDCSSFGSLPPYVQSRINGSYDYACLPEPEDDEEPSPTTTTAPTTTTTPESEQDEEEDPVDDDDPGDGGETDDDHDDDDRDEDGTPDVDDPEGALPRRVAVPTDDECAPVPTATAAADALGRLRWRSHIVLAVGAEPPQQQRLPGGGRYQQVAPGRGWAEIRGSADVSEGECRWVAAWVRASWADQRPWIPAERAAMESHPHTGHLVTRWDALSAHQQQLVRRWHRPGAAPASAVCAVRDASGAGAAESCGWVLASPAAYAWRASICFELDTQGNRAGAELRGGSKPAAEDPCWVQLDSGVEWIRSVSDYADGRVTLTGDGSGS